ncbi:MAG: hypothetical protein R2811_09675 [Flavobacteriales bacterium]
MGIGQDSKAVRIAEQGQNGTTWPTKEQLFDAESQPRLTHQTNRNTAAS